MAPQWTYDIGTPPRAPPEDLELPPVEDLDHTGPGEACPLVQSMFPQAAAKFDTQLVITSLVRVGANPNLPSLHAEGFTPLMCAAGDACEPEVFSTMLDSGGDRGGTGRLSPEGPRVTVLQSLLSGFPRPRCEADDKEMRASQLECLRMGGRQFQQLRVSRPYEVHPFRQKKLEAFIAAGYVPEHFHVEGGRHVLCWAIDNLFGNNMIWSTKLLAKHYKATRLPTDTETPLSVFVSVARAESYFQFGTLPRVYESLKGLLDGGLAEFEESLDPLLIRIAKLPGGIVEDPGDVMWDRMASACEYDPAYKREFLKLVNMDCEQDFAIRLYETVAAAYRGPGNLDFPDIRVRDMASHRHLRRQYETLRGKTIGKMVNVMVAKGANVYAKGPDGKSAHDWLKENKTLQYVGRAYLRKT